MVKLRFSLFLLLGLYSSAAFSFHFNELDRVFVFLNDKLVGTWRADEAGVVHIDNIKDGDTLVFKARTDLGGLGNSSIDVKDDAGVPIDRIQDMNSGSGTADFVYVFNIKKIDPVKVMSVQVFLNMDPERNLSPPTIAIIMVPKK